MQLKPILSNVTKNSFLTIEVNEIPKIYSINHNVPKLLSFSHVQYVMIRYEFRTKIISVSKFRKRVYTPFLLDIFFQKTIILLI